MLKYCLTLPPLVEPRRAAAIPDCTEILLEHRQLARTGDLSTAELEGAAAETRVAGLRRVLVWDVLASDERIADGGALLRRLIETDCCDAVRVQDPGVAQYLRDHFRRLPLQLILETGNHNIPGIAAWVRHFQPERVVLSNELPLALLARIHKAVAVALEVQALGRLLLFYSPRPLLPEEEGEVVQRYAVDPGTAKSFPILRNRHGTFMYYEKDLFLLPWRKELAAAGVSHARLDLVFYTQDIMAPLTDYLGREDPPKDHELTHHLGPKLTRGFFKSNRTDKQFTRLKNTHLLRHDASRFAGTVLETSKKKYISVMTERTIRQGDALIFQLPEGNRVTHSVSWLRDSQGRDVTEAEPPGLWLLNPVPRVSSGTLVYLEDED